MNPQLRVIAGPDQGRVFRLGEGETLVIGRGETTGTRLRDAHVSRTHCQVQVDGGKFVLLNLSASSVTLINGPPITRHELQPGDVIQIGGSQFQFQLSIPDLLEGTLLKMLAKRPEDRQQTPADLMVDLERIAKFQGVAL